MQRKYKVLRLVALALVASGAAMAQAQPPPTPPPDQTPPAGTADTTTTAAPSRRAGEEEIVVTGSRVRRKDLTTPAPVTVISREQLSASGVSTIGEFLQQQPEQGSALNTQVNNGGDGQTQVNLRDLGSQRTLVLVDGKRMVNGGVNSFAGVDLNSIPTAAVERVEILKDGASAVYGSDAVAGVVNIITRKRMDGVEINGYTGVSQRGDANVYDYNLLAGAQGQRGSFMLGAGYYRQDSFFAGNRDWAANALSYDFNAGQEGFSGSGTTPKTRINGFDPTSCGAAAGIGNTPAQQSFCDQLATAFTGGASKKINIIFDPTQSKAGAKYVDGWRLRDSVVDFYNYQAVNYLVTPSERISLFGNGEYRVSDFARAYVQASYVQRDSSFLVAPEPFVTTNASLVVAGANPYNPTGVDLSSVQRRLTDLPGRGSAFDVSTYRVVAGVDGTLSDFAGPLSGWFWDLSVNYGRTAGTQTNTGFLNTVLTGPGLGPGFFDPGTGVATCGTPAAPIDNCTPVNLFGAPGTITPAMQQQLGAYAGTNYGVTQLFMFTANTSGELFSLFADRPAALALGFEHRNEYGLFQYNPVLAGGFDSDTGSPGPADTRGGFYVNEGYGELSVPILNRMPGVETLEASFAARVFNYNTFGTDWTYKLGARYSPIRDFAVRGTYSTAFRAPGILELFQGLAGGNFESSNDPCANSGVGTPLSARCTAAPGSAGGPNVANNGISVAQVNSVNGGTPTLQPEKAKILTVGAVIEPQMVRGLSFTVDYYRISMDQLIGNFGTQLILNKCYGAANVPQDTAFCSNVTRDPATGALSRVLDANVNIGQLLTTGVDFAAQYALPTDYGRFTFRFLGTYLIKYDFTDPQGQLIKGAGNYDGQGVVTASGSTNFNPRVKFNTGVSYGLGGFGANLVAHFIGPLTECSPDGGVVAGANTGPGFCYQGSGVTNPDGSITPYAHHDVSAQWTFDALLQYSFKSMIGGTTLAFGVRNLTDQHPPRLYDSFLTYADPGYDFIGRYFYGRLEHKF
jgi:iron complex outermembrane receptor protein